MKIKVQVKPNSKKIGIDVVSENEWIIRVKEPPTEGKANDAIIKAISKHLNIPKSKIQILYGQKSKIKLVQIN